MNVQDIVNNIILSVRELVSDDVVSTLENSIVMELHKYEIRQQCTDLVVDDQSNYKILKKFLGVKKLENKSDKTIERYYQQLIKMLDFLNKNIADITTDDIRYYLAWKRNKGNCASSVDGIRRILSSFFSWLADEDIIEKNPMRKIHKSKFNQTIRKPFSDDELEAIKQVCDNRRDKALVELLSSTGIRVSECSNIDLQDIDFKEKTIIVTGKGNKQRYVYFSEKCKQVLEKYLIYREDDYEKYHSSTALFVSRNSERLSKNGIEQVVNKLGNKVGVHSYPHKFRRTFCTTLCNKLNIQDVSILMGHSDPKTTTIYNYRNMDKIKKEYMEIMN